MHRDDVTTLLIDWTEGDDQALQKLMPLVYSELHRIAGRYMAGERVGHSLQASALVNEAYLKLVDVRRAGDCRHAARARASAVFPHVAATLVGCVSSLMCLPAYPHDWYPHDCCHDQDCSPVDKVTWFTPSGGGRPLMIISTRHGTAIVPDDLPTQQSNDGRMHACLRHSLGDPYVDVSVICFFVPPPA